MQNPSGMSEEIRAIEISRECFSVGSTYTESVALQSFFSKCWVHPLKEKPHLLYVGCLVYGMSDSCRQRQWVSEPGEDTRVVRAWSVSHTGVFPSLNQKVSWVLAKEKPWSEAPRWKGAAGSATVSSITSFLTPQSKALCPLSHGFKKTDVELC